MLQPQQIEELIAITMTMDKPCLSEALLGFKGSFPVDFTPEFLNALSLDRIRHIYVALCMQAAQLPAAPLVDAA